jgi:hypothetical protein
VSEGAKKPRRDTRRAQEGRQNLREHLSFRRSKGGGERGLAGARWGFELDDHPHCLLPTKFSALPSTERRKIFYAFAVAAKGAGFSFP